MAKQTQVWEKAPVGWLFIQRITSSAPFVESISISIVALVKLHINSCLDSELVLFVGYNLLVAVWLDFSATIALQGLPRRRAPKTSI